MADYSEDIATARELIEESGELIEFRQDGETYNDFVTFIPAGGSVSWLAALAGTAIPAGLELGLLPGDAPFVPKLNGVIVRQDGTVLTVLPGSDRIAPSGDPVLYILRLGE